MSARAAIEQAGGLISLRGIQRRWGYKSSSSAHQLTQRAGFPDPIPYEGADGEGHGVKLWLVNEIDAYRQQRAA